MKKSRHNIVSFASSNEEVHKKNIASWSEYMEYFPRMGSNASSVSDTVITVLLIALTGVLYTFGYLVFVAFRLLVRRR